MLYLGKYNVGLLETRYIIVEASSLSKATEGLSEYLETYIKDYSDIEIIPQLVVHGDRSFSQEC